MLLPLRPAEIVDVVARRTGVTHRELAERMGWRPGTLDTFLARLRSQQTAAREDLDRLARGLADDRFELGSAVTLSHILHAAAGIAPTPDDVAGFVSAYFPEAPDDPAPHYVYDCRGFLCWANPATVALISLLGGPSAGQMTSWLHSWAVASAAGSGGEVPALFRLDTSGSGSDTGPGRPLHLLELAADPAYGIAAVLGSADGDDGAAATEGPAFDQLVRGVRYLRAVWADFRTVDWFAPIDRHLYEVTAYRAAVAAALSTGPDTPVTRRPLDASGVFETIAGPVIFSATGPVHDPRMRMERLLPASAELWATWQQLAAARAAMTEGPDPG